MIRYSLICKKKHDFEAWFRDSADFDAQADKGLVSCPNCGTSSVSKALMAPTSDRGSDSMMVNGWRKLPNWEASTM